MKNDNRDFHLIWYTQTVNGFKIFFPHMRSILFSTWCTLKEFQNEIIYNNVRRTLNDFSGTANVWDLWQATHFILFFFCKTKAILDIL